MPLHNEFNKVMIIGAGPTIIGEVSEMDILGEQVLESFLEENIQVVLLNPNPATVETDWKKNLKVFLEPMTLDFTKRILRMEKPDAIFAAAGGKPALRLLKELENDGILADMNISLLGINDLSLDLQDSRKFHQFLTHYQIPTTQQWLIKDEETIINKLSQVTYPLLLVKKQRYRPDIRRTFKNYEDLKLYFDREKEVDQDHFTYQNYRLTEDLSNFEELILDVIRDPIGNFCFINNSGSLEPVGINSLDSLLVTPIITRNNNQMQQLRRYSKKIADALNFQGALSIHFAVKQSNDEFNFKVLSVKPRLTHTSLLAYRSGVYSVGYVVAKVALGYHLNEIIDPQSGLNAAIEPRKDSFNVRLPYWSFVESGTNHYTLGSKNTSGGAALGKGLNFEAAFMKAFQATTSFTNNLQTVRTELRKSKEEIIKDLNEPWENHLLILAAAIFKEIPYKDLRKATHIHPVFLQKFNHLIALTKKLKQEPLSPELLLKVKKYGFSNRLIAHLTNKPYDEITDLTNQWNIYPSYIRVDGTAGLEEPEISATFSAYGVQDEIKPLAAEKKCLILGLKPFQVSLTGEFDYMLYHAAKTLKEQGISPIIISNNPESISASYNVCDRVYFEPITLENILAVAKKENIQYVLTQFSGKQANRYRLPLLKNGLKIVGQPNIEHTLKLDKTKVIENANVNPVPALTTNQPEEVEEFVLKYGFPLLIGGLSNNQKKPKSAVVFDVPALNKYITENELQEIIISEFIEGKKYEVTAISDGENVTIPGIIEHFEQTGSHASDSIAIYRPQNLSSTQQRLLRDSTVNIIKQFKLRGPVNLHFLIANNQIYVLQIKTYAGHNISFLTKSIHQNIVKIATQVLLGANLPDLNLANDVWPSSSLIHVKMPVFSSLQYHGENTFDSQMKTSGSVMGQAVRLPTALYKGYEAADLIIPSYGTVFISVKDAEKEDAVKIAARFHRLGFTLLATEGTATILAEKGITTGIVKKLQDGNNGILEKITQHRINMVINVTNLSDSASHDAILIQDTALETHIPVLSSLQSAADILTVLETMAMTTQPL